MPKVRVMNSTFNPHTMGKNVIRDNSKLFLPEYGLVSLEKIQLEKGFSLRNTDSSSSKYHVIPDVFCLINGNPFMVELCNTSPVPLSKELLLHEFKINGVQPGCIEIFVGDCDSVSALEHRLFSAEIVKFSRWILRINLEVCADATLQA